MILIGESINVMSKTIGPAMKGRNKEPIQNMAIEQKEKGADYLDLNIGPARKDGPQLMEWIVQVVQEVVDLPLFLDTTNVEAIEAGLKVCQQKAVINSISCREERISALLPLIKKYNCGYVALLWGPEGMPRDAAERGMFTAEHMAKAEELGIPMSDLWIDGIAAPICAQQDQVKSLLEFMQMLKDLAPGCSSTCGLSNVSNGCPQELRGIVNRTYMVMLQKYGMSSAIVDVYDKELVDIARGKREDIVNLIYKVMDGEEVDLSKLSKEEADYVKTTKVLLGHSLYSHSWLQI